MWKDGDWDISLCGWAPCFPSGSPVRVAFQCWVLCRLVWRIAVAPLSPHGGGIAPGRFF